MFWFFKKVNEENIKSFSEAIKAINIYISLYEWEKARSWAFEILKKEKESFEKYLNENNDSERKIEKNKNIFLKREEEIKSLLEKINLYEKNYIENEQKQKFKARIKSIELQINKLLYKWESEDALGLLEDFFQENRDNIEVLNFYKKQKNIIKKSLNKKLWNLEERIKANPKLEALSLIWEKITNKDLEKTKKEWFFSKLFKKFSFWLKLKKKRKEKQLLDEINILIEEDDKVKKEVLEKKLKKLQSWVKKEIFFDEMIWYDLYWKIENKKDILKNIFWVKEEKNDYFMFFWNSTTEFFEKSAFLITFFVETIKSIKNKNFKELFFELNNKIKQKLESKSFVSGAIFHINKNDSSLEAIWMWHKNIFIFRQETWEIEQKNFWVLASWVRIFQNIDQVKIKNIEIKKDDILLIFSDNLEWNILENILEIFKNEAKNEQNLKNIYSKIYQEIKDLQKETNFLFLKRNTDKDLIKKWDLFLEKIKKRENLKSNQVQDFEWKRKNDIDKKLEEIKKKQRMEIIISDLKELYYSWEILQLKREAIKAIKDGFIHKDINFYLKKAIENENKYKIERKNQKMQNKYNILAGLYKKWDYDTVIKEIEYIILKDWNI